MSSVVVIGAGVAGISAAAYLSRSGHEVQVFEKNSSPGGRARQLCTDNGYSFDMGPSWYWMPEVYEHFFHDFGATRAEHYHLQLLDPSFDVVFPGREVWSIPHDFEELRSLFESVEHGAGTRLRLFMQEAEFKYRVGMKKLEGMPGKSVTEWLDADLIRGAMRLQVFSPFGKHVRKHFKDPRLVTLMEFPVLFLGGAPEAMPALYSLMSYAGFRLGTWYPRGGFASVVNAMATVARGLGASFQFDSPVQRIVHNGKRATGVIVNGREVPCDAIVAAADYHYVEQELLDTRFRNYSEAYWEKRTLAPSCLIFYIGLSKKLDNIRHHTLFFDEDLGVHAREIYLHPRWPERPLFYVCCPSKSDDSVAPRGHENLFFLMPVAPGLDDRDILRELYFDRIVSRFNAHVGEDIRPYIDFKHSYCLRDFADDYHAYKGNAYGLANTLSQTGTGKPKMRNNALGNLFYSGQLTVPGPGVPPAILSGKMCARELSKYLKRAGDEKAVR